MLPMADRLGLESCPHCGVDMPDLRACVGPFETIDYLRRNPRSWRVYVCARCGGLVTAGGPSGVLGIAGVPEARETYPSQAGVDESIPAKAREFLRQSMTSLKAPAGAIMLAASAVDAMLKEKGYKEGSLNTRIRAAADAHLITEEMAAWAHDVRLDANDQRHADDDAPLPGETDARRALDFALALGTFMFVLPARVARGREDAKPKA
jgi:hypothetical protein